MGRMSKEQKLISVLEAELAVAKTELYSAKLANVSLTEDRNSTHEVLKRSIEERDTLRAALIKHTRDLQNITSGLDAAKIEIANLQRLNAIQAGYIQRANEDELVKEAGSYSPNSITRHREGPRLDYDRIGASLAERDFALRHSR